MVFHENRLLADDSLEYHNLFLSKIGKDVSKFVVCCSRDWRFKDKKTKQTSHEKQLDLRGT